MEIYSLLINSCSFSKLANVDSVPTIFNKGFNLNCWQLNMRVELVARRESRETFEECVTHHYLIVNGDYYDHFFLVIFKSINEGKTTINDNIL